MKDYSETLRLLPEGYWSAATMSEVSYPDEGNDTCFAVEDRSFWFRHRNAVIQDAVKKFPPAGPIFDIGGGNGFVASGLEAAGFPTVLVEPGLAGVRNARGRGLRNVIHSTLEDADFKPGTIPAAAMFDVLEHIPDDVAFLRKLHTLMKPDGRIYMSVPAHRWLWSSADDFAAHQRRYTRPLLRESLRRGGFSVEYMTYFFWLLPLPILLLRAIPWALHIGRKTSAARIQRELGARQSLGARMMESILGWERGRIAKGRTLCFGGSIFAVAKPDSDTGGA